MFNDFLTINYAAAIGLTFLLLFILSNGHLDKKIKKVFLILIAVEAVEAIVYSLELWTATFETLSLWRIFFSAVGYSVRPIILYAIFSLVIRNRSKKFKIWCAVPAIFNIFIAFSAFFTDVVYGYTQDNHFVRGPLGYTSLVILVGYMVAVFLYTVIQNKKMVQAEVYMLLTIIVVSIVSLLIEAIFEVRSINRTTLVLAIIFYYMYFISDTYKNSIDESRRMLKEKEEEGLQLLAAIQQSYDMVVSVNLTKNTYHLFSNETFVTQGDKIVGNFDDIINIHRTKVVDEHKEIYYNTFSRKALLKAHKDGQKSVYLQYQQMDDEGVPHWLGTHTMFTKNPYSDDVTEITISRNIDKRIKKEAAAKAALEEAMQKAEYANKAKSHFLSTMSHDIRTPMNAIVGMTNLAINSIDDKEAATNYLKKVQLASNHLLTLINDVLDISKVESGKTVLMPFAFSLSKEMEKLATIVAPQIEERMQKLEINTGELLVDYVYMDQVRLSQVMMNVLSNAIKYTHTGGHIRVTLSSKTIDSTAKKARIVYRVEDNGIGMSEEFQKDMYSAFARENIVLKNKIQGSGLGLSICKQMVELMGGTIECISEVGKGTTFIITVDVPIANTPLGEENSNDKLDDASDLQGVKILVAEDNDFNWEISHELMKMNGVETVRAVNGQECVNIISNASDGEFDLILMDIQMPIKNGYEATQEIRSSNREYLKKIPIIAVTADAFAEDIDRCLDAGMNAHIAKPIDIQKLLEVIRSVKYKNNAKI